MTTPEYADIAFTRHRGRSITIDHAPSHTRLELRVLLDRYAYLHMPTPDTIVFADQVVYRITDYNPAAGMFTLELVEDWRKASGVLTFDHRLTEAEVDEIKSRWQERYGKPDTANHAPAPTPEEQPHA